MSNVQPNSLFKIDWL